MKKNGNQVILSLFQVMFIEEQDNHEVGSRTTVRLLSGVRLTIGTVEEDIVVSEGCGVAEAMWDRTRPQSRAPAMEKARKEVINVATQNAFAKVNLASPLGSVSF